MAYHDDLIEHAILLSQYNLPNDPKQADLRRAVSATYYALFHLLTTEAAQNWKHQSQRIRFCPNVRSWPHEDVLFEGIIAPPSH